MLNPQDFKALDLSQPIDFRSMLKSGELLLGTSCRIPHDEAARITATLPHQFCFLDAEHVPFSATLLVSMIRTIQYTSDGSMVPYVRLPAKDPDMINHVLNAGAGGIVQPHVQTAQQARDLVNLAKFAPLGQRSFPPISLLGRQTRTPPGKTIYDVYNDNTAVFAQIEDVEGVKNVEEIAAVEGLDALMVGSADLRFSLGITDGSFDGDEPEFVAALEKIQRAADANGLAVLGLAATPEMLARRIKLGWRAIIVYFDTVGISMSGTKSFEDSLQLAEQIKHEGNVQKKGGKGGDEAKLDNSNQIQNGQEKPPGDSESASDSDSDSDSDSSTHSNVQIITVLTKGNECETGMQGKQDIINSPEETVISMTETVEGV